MLFFQVVLLLGYLYAHWLNRKLEPAPAGDRRTSWFSPSSLAVAADPAQSRLEDVGDRAALAAHPGPAGGHGRTAVFSALLDQSAAAGVVRAHSQERPAVPPVRAFEFRVAAGAAELSGADRAEPAEPRRRGSAWSVAYACFAIVCAATAWRRPRCSRRRRAECRGGGRSRLPSQRGPSGCSGSGSRPAASVLLLAVTTHLTQDVAPIPFSGSCRSTVYLLSFILCFESPRIYWRPLFLPLFAVAMAFMAFQPVAGRIASSKRPCCNFVADHEQPLDHRDVRRRSLRLLHGVSRRVGASQTASALSDRLLRHRVAWAGPSADCSSAWSRPNFFRAYYEFPIGLGICAAVVALVLARRLRDAPTGRRLGIAGAVAAVLCAYLWGLGIVMRDMSEAIRGDAQFLRTAARYTTTATRPRRGRSAQARPRHHQPRPANATRTSTAANPSPTSVRIPGIGRAMRASEGAPRRIGILGSGLRHIGGLRTRRATHCGFTRSIRRCSTSRAAISHTCATRRRASRSRRATAAWCSNPSRRRSSTCS